MADRPRTRTYEVYCGNYDCPSRIAGRTFTVTEGFDLIDGELWLCVNCRPEQPVPVADIETRGRT